MVRNASRRTRGGRDFWVDNLLALAVLLVAFDQLLLVMDQFAPVMDHPGLLNCVRKLLTYVHLPTLCLAGGMSCAGHIRERRYDLMTLKLFWPFLLFNFLTFAVVMMLGISKVNGVPQTAGFVALQPYYGLWLPLALYLFSSVTPGMLRLRHPLALAALAALAIGFAHPVRYMELTKIVPLYFYFLLGVQLNRARLKRFLKRGGVMLASWLLLAAACALTFLLRNAIDLGALTMEAQYRALSYPLWAGPVARAGFMALSLLLTLAFFSVAPQRRSFLSALGRGWMTPYCLFSVLTPALYHLTLQVSPAHLSALVALAAALALSLILAALLGNAAMRRLTRPLTDPQLPPRAAAMLEALVMGDPEEARHAPSKRTARPQGEGRAL